MLDNKGFFVVAEALVAIAGVLFWFSESFAHAVGVIGFFPRLFAGIISFVIAIILHAVATR
jgi:hypothetical protein